MKILAWHWVRDDCTLRDGSPLVIGEPRIHTGKLELCKSGFHGSRRALDALKYAPGSICCRVKLGGEIIQDPDKMVATERTALWAIDATETLRIFARWCALEVIHLWNAPEVVRRYLVTGDESLRAAARAATWTAGDAAWDKQNEKLEAMLVAQYEAEWSDHGNPKRPS